jgi:hypothetical protein
MATLASAPSGGWSGEDRHAATDLFSPYMVQTLADCAAIGNVELEQWPWVATSAATRHSRTRPRRLVHGDVGLGLAQRSGFALPENASPKKTAANTKKTTPMPESSRVKSTIAMMRNRTPARALPSDCLDISRLYPLRASFRQSLIGGPGKTDDSSFGVIGLRRGYRIACAHSDPADVRCRGHQTLLSRLPRVPARLAGR